MIGRQFHHEGGGLARKELRLFQNDTRNHDRGDADEIRARLETLSPAVIDEMPLDFEEAFIHDVLSGRGKK